MKTNPKIKKTKEFIKESLCFAHILLATAYIICISFICFTPALYEDYDFRLTYGDDISAKAQLYYDTGEWYTEEHSILCTVENKTADFPLDDNIRKNAIAFRFDPMGGQTMELSLRSLSILLNGKEIKRYSGQAFKDLIASTNHIDEIQVKNESIVLPIIDTDPYFILKDDFTNAISDSVQEYNNYISIIYILYASIITLLLCTLLCFRKRLILLINGFLCSIKNKIGSERVDKIKEYWCAHTQRLSIGRKILYGITVITFLLSVILYTLGHFLIDHFSGLTMSEIVFHLKVPMEGTSNDMVAQYFNSAKMLLITSCIVLVIAIILLVLKKNIRNCRLTSILALFLSFCLLLLSTFNISEELNLPEYIANQMKTSSFIEDNYVVPEESLITFPDAKRNLIYIYLESMESTFISKQDGGCMTEDIIPELTQLAKDHINFSESDQVGGGTSSAGSTWTVGAMVAMTCGLPLLIPVDGNSYGGYVKFMPGAVSLGEILKDNGYTQEIMVGSDLSFGGRRNYFTQHGDYQVYDIFTARGREDLPDDYNVWWGYEDAKLFSYAKEEITRLAKGNEPFNFTMLTVDTHHIGGYVCELCQNNHEDQYENVLSCSSRQVAGFVEWLKNQDFYDNTTIIISGDHPTMDAQYIDKHYDGSQPRKVYNCFINAAKDSTTSKNRDFNTFDMFPTTLAAMGCEISGDRLGLGTNLFSGKKTLAESYGYEKIDDEFSRRSQFYEKNILHE